VFAPLGLAVVLACPPHKTRNYDKQLTTQKGFLQAHLSAVCNNFFTLDLPENILSV
jgi:hypothetical protein